MSLNILKNKTIHGHASVRSDKKQWFTFFSFPTFMVYAQVKLGNKKTKVAWKQNLWSSLPSPKEVYEGSRAWVTDCLKCEGTVAGHDSTKLVLNKTYDKVPENNDSSPYEIFHELPTILMNIFVIKKCSKKIPFLNWFYACRSVKIWIWKLHFLFENYGVKGYLYKKYR